MAEDRRPVVAQQTTEVHGTANRFKAWGLAIRARLRKPRWIIALLGTAAVFTAEAFGGDIAVRLATFLFGLAADLVKRPVGILGLAFFLLLAALIVRAYWETRPKAAKKGDQLWILQERLKLAKSVEQFAEDQHAEDERKLGERDTYIRDVDDALARTKAESRALFQQLNYGDHLIDPIPLDSADFVVMFTSVEQMMPNVTAAIGNADKVWRYLMSKSPTDDKEALPWLVGFIQEGTVNHARRSYSLLSELMKTRQDPRAGLAALYMRYCDWRTWIERFSAIVHHHFYSVPAYVDWRKHDLQFFADVRQRNSTSHFAEVRNALKAYHDAYGVPKTLPDPERDP